MQLVIVIWSVGYPQIGFSGTQNGLNTNWKWIFFIFQPIFFCRPYLMIFHIFLQLFGHLKHTKNHQIWRKFDENWRRILFNFPQIFAIFEDYVKVKRLSKELGKLEKLLRIKYLTNMAKNWASITPPKNKFQICPDPSL